MWGIKKGPLHLGSRPGVSINALTQPGAPPERMVLSSTLRLAVYGAIMVPHYYALRWIRQGRTGLSSRADVRDREAGLDSLGMMS